jgi:UDPglucose 6-dehydrogenase
MKVKSICCIGAGYVGGPTMSVIALKCPNLKVTVVDVNEERINSWNGPLDKLPIYEPGLSKVVGEVRGKNLFFSTDIERAIQESEMIFMAVNTPTKTEGEGAGMAADLKYVEASAKKIGQSATTDKIVVEKSTLPVRTAEKIKEILNKHGNGLHFEILSNPEFLAEGTAIQDLFKSDRVLIGGDSTPSGKKAVNALVDIYSQWIPEEKILTTNVWSSELAKLASNAMLAQRVSSINSLSALCEITGGKIRELSKAVGMDHRIGTKFLKASVGFGGSCFQKDILNLVYLCRYYGLDEVAEYWHQVVKINEYQKHRFSSRVIEYFEHNKLDKKISILGWSFKSNSNDSRESPSIYVAKYLLEAGFHLNIYDPKVSSDRINEDLSTFNQNSNQIYIHNSLEEVLNSSRTLLILNDWDEFKRLDFNKHNIFNGSFLNIPECIYQIGN